MHTKTLIIGATGFIGSNLLSLLEDKSIPVRVMARTPSKVISTKDSTEVVYGDLANPETIESALKDVGVVYYLAH